MERAAYFTPGPRFFEQDGQTLFEYRIDSGNIIGPRKATPEDMKRHAKAWDALVDAKTAPEGTPLAEPEADAPRRRGRPPKAA